MIITFDTLFDKGEQLENFISYLEHECCFRDYEVMSEDCYGKVNAARSIHQKIDLNDFEHCVDDAINTFVRDGFGTIYFYIED